MDNNEFRIYADESSHLGESPFMVIGAVWCNKNEVRNFTDKVKMVKAKYGIPEKVEIKWAKISGSKEVFYIELIKTFFGEEGVNFRAIVIPTEGLNHELYNQTEDEFYYKAQYMMLKNVVSKLSANGKKTFRIFLDYKDSWSDTRSKRLADYLQNTRTLSDNTFSCQPVRSEQSVLIQMADLLTGAVASANNSPNKRVLAKQNVIEAIEKKAGQKLTDKTPYGVDKFNIFRWHDADSNHDGVE